MALDLICGDMMGHDTMLCFILSCCFPTNFAFRGQERENVVSVKRKDLFRLLGLIDPLDLVDPTEVIFQLNKILKCP